MEPNAIDPNLLSFFGWWQLVVCAFAFAALMGIWWHIGRRQKDLGQVFLAISILCWSLSGLVEVYYAQQFQANISLEVASKMDGWRSILSLTNSLFILMALRYFRYIPKALEPIIKSKYWGLIIGLLFLFALLPTVRKILSEQTLDWINELDAYYAMGTLFVLGWVLWESFKKRRLAILAWLSIACILVTFAAQLYKLTGSYINLALFSAIFKTTLIMIFFALALSWVKELSENILPGPHQLFLSFGREKQESGKFTHWVSLRGFFSGEDNRKLPLTPALFELCLRFAHRKTKTQDGWLEIKPKSESRPSKDYDINDHNQIKRLLVALLNGLYGKDCWTKEHHLEPLRTTLFERSEKRERKVRLRIPTPNITLLDT